MSTDQRNHTTPWQSFQADIGGCETQCQCWPPKIMTNWWHNKQKNRPSIFSEQVWWQQGAPSESASCGGRHRTRRERIHRQRGCSRREWRGRNQRRERRYSRREPVKRSRRARLRALAQRRCCCGMIWYNPLQDHNFRSSGRRRTKKKTQLTKQRNTKKQNKEAKQPNKTKKHNKETKQRNKTKRHNKETQRNKSKNNTNKQTHMRHV